MVKRERIQDAITQKVAAQVRSFVASAPRTIDNPDGKSNVGRLLFEVFIWQEIERLVKKNLDVAWAQVQEKTTGLIPDDDQLRINIEPGPAQEVSTSAHFSLTVETKSGGSTIDLPAFMGTIAEKYKIKPESLDAIAKAMRKAKKNSVTKRVLERT